MSAKFAEGEKGGCPPCKEGEKIDLRIAHWCLYAPRASGMYETVRELIGAEMKIEGVLPYFCETPPTNKPNAMEVKKAAEGGHVDPMFPELRSQDWGLAMKWADVHVIHSTMSNKVGEIKPKVMWLHGCFYREQLIRMADGSTKPIHAIRKGDWVLSWNKTSGIAEPQKVIWAGKNGTSTKWLRIVTEYGPIQMPTWDHPFCLWDDSTEIYAENLKIGDELEAIKPVLSPLQREVILGKLMGDGHYHHHGIEWSHKMEHEEYSHLLLKLFKNYDHWFRDQISGYGSPMKRVRISLGTGFRDINPLVDLKKICYTDGIKMITDDFLKQFSWTSLAILYYDDGNIVTHHYKKQNGENSHYVTGVDFALCSFDEEEVEHIAEVFTEKFDIKFSASNCDYPRMHIYGKENLNIFFINIVRGFPIPSCMAYKIPEKYRQGAIPEIEDELHFEIFPNRIIEINKEKPFPRYNEGSEYARWAITVEGNHNYYAGLNLVGNTPEACLQNEATEGMRSFSSAAEWVNKFEASICTSRRAFKHWGVFDYTGKKLYQVKKGIDLSWWQRSTTVQDLDGEPSVLYGEVWRGIKHPYHLIHAMDTLHRRNPKAILNVWGCYDPEGFWKKFFSYGNFDRFLGKRGLRGQEEYPSHWYSRGDVLVSPVIHGDVSRTAQEALASGCPTIVWDSDPYGDNIAYKYAKAFDEDNLADRIEEVGNEVLDDREGVAKRCRELAVKNYDINFEAKQVVDILRTVVSESK